MWGAGGAGRGGPCRPARSQCSCPCAPSLHWAPPVSAHRHVGDTVFVQGECLPAAMRCCVGVPVWGGCPAGRLADRGDTTIAATPADAGQDSRSLCKPGGSAGGPCLAGQTVYEVVQIALELELRSLYTRCMVWGAALPGSGNLAPDLCGCMLMLSTTWSQPVAGPAIMVPTCTASFSHLPLAWC